MYTIKHIPKESSNKAETRVSASSDYLNSSGLFSSRSVKKINSQVDGSGAEKK
jgi:hypothetical protein